MLDISCKFKKNHSNVVTDEFSFFFIFHHFSPFFTYFLKKIRFKATFWLVSMANQKSQKVAQKFLCEKCNYITSKQNDFNKHVLTAKHKRLNFMANKKSLKSDIIYDCICGKKYKHLSSLSKHKKNCEFIDFFRENEKHEKYEKMDISGNNEIISIIDDKDIVDITESMEKNELIIQLIKENKELQKTIINQNSTFIEQQEKHNKNLTEKINSITPVISNTTNNTMNNNYSINLFLNEKCKDALNIMDFVNSLTIEMKDLENTGSRGFVEGMSNIIVKAIQGLDVTKRPIHCTDSKKETLYVKDNEIWEQDNNKEKIKEAIQHIKQNNVRKLAEWVIANPECENMDSPLNKMYTDILNQTIITNDKNISKVIKNVSKHVIIDKED